MQSWMLLVLFASACSTTEPPRTLVPELSGRLENASIREASGLARSQRRPGVLWIINDNGAKEIVHAIDHTGARLGEFELKSSRNEDWEDLASFELNGTPYLMVADIGDNEARRDHRSLYFVEEPVHPADNEATTDWQIDYVYPDGPRDAESAAVDIERQRVLILSKRDIPPMLYEVPLRAGFGDTMSGETTITATRLGAVESLHPPSKQDIAQAPRNRDWFWQPVGMDISEDNRAAVILTYRAVYYYQRQARQDWLDALNTVPVRISLGDFKNAEAIAFGDNERTVFVTGENKHSRVLRIDFPGMTP